MNTTQGTARKPGSGFGVMEVCGTVVVRAAGLQRGTRRVCTEEGTRVLDKYGFLDGLPTYLPRVQKKWS